VSRGFETVVQFALHFFPDGVPVGFDDHATAHGRMLGQIAAFDHVEVPLPVILRPRRDAGGVGCCRFSCGRLSHGKTMNHRGRPGKQFCAKTRKGFDLPD